MGPFGKIDKQPKTQLKEWTSTLRKERFQLDRQIRSIQREEEKVKKELKEAAKRGDNDVCRVLAKEIIRARKSINRIHTSKAQINSVEMSLNHQFSTLRIVGTIKKSTDVMQSMQNLLKCTEISHTIQEMSKEMMRAGIIEEMMEDTFEGLGDDNEGIEDEAQDEIDKLLSELTAGQLGTAPDIVSELPVTEKEEISEVISAKQSEDFDDMQKRLHMLRS